MTSRREGLRDWELSSTSLKVEPRESNQKRVVVELFTSAIYIIYLLSIPRETVTGIAA